MRQAGPGVARNVDDAAALEREVVGHGPEKYSGAVTAQPRHRDHTVISTRQTACDARCYTFYRDVTRANHAGHTPPLPLEARCSRAWSPRRGLSVRRLACFSIVVLLGVRAASAQVTPAAGFTPPDDTPSIKVGVTLYADFTYAEAPETKDADGNVIHASGFNVTRSYINVTGNINHIVAFRITPDIVRQSGLITLGPGSSISQRQSALPDQVRVRAVQPRRLDDQGVVGAVRDPSDAASRLRGRDLPLPLSGDDVHRARRLLQFRRRRRVVPLERAVELRRHPRRRVQRRGLREDGPQRSEGDRSPRHRCGRSREPSPFFVDCG